MTTTKGFLVRMPPQSTVGYGNLDLMRLEKIIPKNKPLNTTCRVSIGWEPRHSNTKDALTTI